MANHNSSNNKNQKPREQPNKYIKFTSIALQMGLTIYLGNALGKWLDQKYQLQYLETTLTLFAIFASMYLVIAQVIQTSKDDE